MSNANTASVPTGWMLVLIRDVANAESGYGFPNHLQGRSSGEIPFAKVSDISRAVEAGDRYLDGAANYVTESDAQALRAVPMPPNTVIFAKIGGAIELNRRVILARSTIVDNNVMGLSPEIDIGPTYLYYFMLTQRLGALSRATTVPSLRRGDVERIEFPLAPTAEQSRITDALDELFSDLDAGVAALERVREKLKLYRASVLKAAVEGALTAEWRAQHPYTESATELLRRIVAERRRRWEEDQLAKFKAKGQQSPQNWTAKYKVPVAPDTTDLPPLPEGWCWATVDQCSLLIQYGTSAKTREEADGIAVLRMGNLTSDGRLTLDDFKYLPNNHLEFPDLLLAEGDLLFNRTNSAELVGKTAIYSGIPTPCSFASYLIRVRLIAGLSPSIVRFTLNGGFGRAWIKDVANQTVGQANVNGSKLAAFAFPLPTIAEQEAIVEAVEDQLSIIDHLEADLDAKLESAQALRQAILRHAFTGQLVRQNPNDEPASELLKRIAAEREARAREYAGRKLGGAHNRKHRASRGGRLPA